MTSPQIETVEEVEQLTPEAQAARAAAEAREIAPPMPTPVVVPKLPWRTRLKLWWYGVGLKLTGWACRRFGIVAVHGAHYHDAMAEFARLLSFLEKSGALAHAPHARSKIGRGIDTIIRLLATGEQLASEASYKQTLATYRAARSASTSRKRKQKAAQRIFALVRAQSLLNKARGVELKRMANQAGDAKLSEKKLGRMHARIVPIIKVEPPKDPPAAK